MKAIQIEAFGNPVEVVKAVDVPDVGAPAAGEVVIALEGTLYVDSCVIHLTRCLRRTSND